MRPNLLQVVTALSLIALMVACASPRSLPEQVQAVPEWSQQALREPVAVNWLAADDQDAYGALFREALTNNFSLQQSAALLDEQRGAVVVASAGRWPTLDLSVDGSRRDTQANRIAIGEDGEQQSSSSTVDVFGADLSSRWELDVWGELSASARAARLDYEAALAQFEDDRRQLIADVSLAANSLITERALVSLFEERLRNLTDAFDIVDGSYRRGIASALDVYLAKNTLEQQQATVAAQRQTALEAATRLEVLLGRYPRGDIAVPAKLPGGRQQIAAGTPAELILRRQDLAAAWLQLLAADQRLAAAHRARFPSFVLTANKGLVSTEFSELISNGSDTLSLAASLTQPLFAAGRLRAQEAQAKARAVAAEQSYLAQVYSAFAEVENAIGAQGALRQRLDALALAETNALAAVELSLEQYQRGLVPYTTVLESERRAFDAATSLLRLQNELASGRAALYLALGGEFTLDTTDVEP